MSGDLQDLMHGAEDAKRRAFATEDFAGGYGRSVIGRVKRRRVASATAMGGGTVVAVGALAVGASTVPWGTFVFGTSPAGLPSVVCTTTTPDAVVTEPTLSIVRVHTEGESQGTGDPGRSSWVVVLGEGRPDERPVASLHLDGDVLTAAIADGDVQTLLPGADGRYRVVLSEGSEMVVALTADEIEIDSFPMPTAVGAASPAASLSVECVTPEPSASQGISEGPSPAPTPSTRVIGDSPFQCDYVLATGGRTTDDVSVGDTTWVFADQAEATIRAEYAEPDAVQLRLSGDRVPVTKIDLAAQWHRDDVPGMLISGDPAELGGEATADEFREAFGDYLVGVQYVLAIDGTVVATGVRDGGDQAQYMTSSPLGAVLYGLDLDAGMVPCAGVDDSTLGDADVVAVAGISYVVDDEISGPDYAWRYVERTE